MKTSAKHIELLYDRIKDYTDTTIEVYKLNAVVVTADILSSIVTRVVLVLFFLLFTLFVNIAISLLIGHLIGAYHLGFLIVSGFYFILTMLVYRFRNKWIKTPVANLVISKLLKKGQKEQIQY
jgi:hypothetical protein